MTESQVKYFLLLLLNWPIEWLYFTFPSTKNEKHCFPVSWQQQVYSLKENKKMKSTFWTWSKDLFNLKFYKLIHIHLIEILQFYIFI